MLSEIISEIESIVGNLTDAQMASDVDDAVYYLENAASELRAQADELEQAATKLRDAKEVLS